MITRLAKWRMVQTKHKIVSGGVRLSCLNIIKLSIFTLDRVGQLDIDPIPLGKDACNYNLKGGKIIRGRGTGFWDSIQCSIIQRA